LGDRHSLIDHDHQPEKFCAAARLISIKIDTRPRSLLVERSPFQAFAATGGSQRQIALDDPKIIDRAISLISVAPGRTPEETQAAREPQHPHFTGR